MTDNVPTGRELEALKVLWARGQGHGARDLPGDETALRVKESWPIRQCSA